MPRIAALADGSNPRSWYARSRARVANGLLLTASGIPMVFMGQEMLITNQFSDSTPLNWANKTTYTNVVNFYRDLIHLRRNLDGVSLGLTGPSIASHVVDDTAKVLAFHRYDGAAVGSLGNLRHLAWELGEGGLGHEARRDFQELAQAGEAFQPR